MRKKEFFTRPEPNTFGVIEFDSVATADDFVDLNAQEEEEDAIPF